MQRFARIFAAALPLMMAGGTVFAEDVVIRIEAKRSTEAATEAARIWGESFPDVVTFPLSQGWVGIALGPMPRETADARLQELQDSRQVPADSFIASVEGRDLTPVVGLPGETIKQDEATTPPPAASPSLFNPGALKGAQPAIPTDPKPASEPADAAEPAPLPDPASFYIRLDSSPDLQRAETALVTYRELLPEAGIWHLPNGRFAVAIGPMPREAGDQWLAALRTADAVPRDAFVTSTADLGEEVIKGSPPELGMILDAETPKPPMPPLEEIQRALRWAGHYEGAIDGKDGPMTRAAIAREVVVLRASPDTATAMTELIQRREEWRAEIGLQDLQDAYTGLSLPAPMDRLQFDRNERALSIYGPKDGSGAALILFSQPGGQQEMLDLTGLITALGWVPSPERRISQDSAILSGRNDTHIGYAEASVTEGQAQGFVLIWPVADSENQPRIAAEMADGFARFSAPANDMAFDTTDARTAAETEPTPPAALADPDTSR